MQAYLKTLVVIFCLSFCCLPSLADCPSADLTGDCYVDFWDIHILATEWLNECNEPYWCGLADITQNDIVNLSDFAVLASQWLTGNRNMVSIPAGTFQMGDSKGGGNPSELPVHTVTVDLFYMGKYEITNQQYCSFLNSAAVKVVNGVVYASTDSGNSYAYCSTSAVAGLYSQIAYDGEVFSVLSKDGRSMSDDPMVCVSWYGSAAYCNWRSQQEGKELCYNLSTWDCDFTKHGYRLATEAEWEYAARGGLSGKRFPWGDTISQTQANFYSSSSYDYDVSPTKDIYHPIWGVGNSPYTSPVGFFDGTLKNKTDYNWPASASTYPTASGTNNFGLHDMAGNAFEWCNDWYAGTYYSSSPVLNPTGPASSTYRVLRGGSFNFSVSYCCVSCRSFNEPSTRYLSIGLRIVLDLN